MVEEHFFDQMGPVFLQFNYETVKFGIAEPCDHFAIQIVDVDYSLWNP